MQTPSHAFCDYLLRKPVLVFIRKLIQCPFVSNPLFMKPKKHELPKLKYQYHELEPYIDATTMQLHHAKHHQSYVDGLNASEEKLAHARETGDFSSVKHLKREIAFHGSGHFLHAVYWDIMTPNGRALDHEKLAQAIDDKFTDFTGLEREFKATGTAVEGSGWAILGVRPDGVLELYSAEKHQNLTQWGTIPILACDVWEHAYYLSYQNRRAEYIENFWKIIDWAAVAERYDRAVS